jgi:hypothetical protein
MNLQRRGTCCTYATSSKSVWVTLLSSSTVHIMESMPVVIFKVKFIQLYCPQRHRGSGCLVQFLEEILLSHTSASFLQELMERGLHRNDASGRLTADRSGPKKRINLKMDCFLESLKTIAWPVVMGFSCSVL